MDFKGMLVSVGFSMAKIPIPPLMLLGKMTGVSNRLLLSWSAYAFSRGYGIILYDSFSCYLFNFI